MNYPDQIEELGECLLDGEIEFGPHINFITEHYRNYVRSSKEPLSPWVGSYIDYLWQRYADGDYDLTWRDYLEESDMLDDWLKHKATQHEFDAKYGIAWD